MEPTESDLKGFRQIYPVIANCRMFAKPKSQRMWVWTDDMAALPRCPPPHRRCELSIRDVSGIHLLQDQLMKKEVKCLKLTIGPGPLDLLYPTESLIGEKKFDLHCFSSQLLHRPDTWWLGWSGLPQFGKPDSLADGEITTHNGPPWVLRLAAILTRMHACMKMLK